MSEDLSDRTPDLELATAKNLTAFYAALGELTVQWNQAEGALRTILISFCGARPQTWILTAELRATSLTNALKSAAVDLGPEHLRAHISHAILWFDRLREYRNYFVHGIQRVTFGKHLIPIGIIGQTSAKTRIVFHQEEIYKERIDDLKFKIKDFIAFILDVELHVAELPLTSFADGTPLPALPQMPPLPDRLEKPRRYLQDDPLQPVVSQEKSKPPTHG